MSDETKKKATTKIVSVNWEGLKRFLGWQGSIAELKRLQLDRATPAGDAHISSAAASGKNR